MPRLLPPFLCLSLISCIAAAPADAPKPEADPRVELARKLPGDVQPEELTPTAIPGLYELARGMEIGYVSADGRYFISGELIDLKTRISLTEKTRHIARRKLLESVPEGQMVVFGPDKPRYTLTVFTDLDCVFCRKLHADIDELNNMGIKVRYLFWPLRGEGSESWKRAENVWCSKNRKEAFNRAVRGETVAQAHCDAGVIARHYALGLQLGLQGTPGLIAADGALVAQYLPPAQVLELVRQAGN